ncbi:hypothetical protein M438DRAFT_57414 [Aureobasidium pullulans EXF-150]|uniref:Uncharacterized protein n=1 Tax=Aureobasidium pullulans EXF-150 TaxID=1043002 RepID=A0A074XJG7_AURPU|nr:uncharacterized protein M438DRAFT_57414 [Aureobasidium pullulans EXF-150]KEQ82182.1 hypothetical protein M438DRAFT_57414 [Aureobasidium pullulans EXF-150]
MSKAIPDNYFKNQSSCFTKQPNTFPPLNRVPLVASIIRVLKSTTTRTRYTLKCWCANKHLCRASKCKRSPDSTRFPSSFSELSTRPPQRHQGCKKMVYRLSAGQKNDACRTRTCAPEGNRFLVYRYNHSAKAPVIASNASELSQIEQVCLSHQLVLQAKQRSKSIVLFLENICQ